MSKGKQPEALANRSLLDDFEAVPMLVPKPPSPCFAVSRWVFARALGLIFLFAFGSLAGQVRGLIGSRGVIPFREFLQAARGQLGPSAYWKVPTIFWFCPWDSCLVAVCLIGVLISVALMLRLSPENLRRTSLVPLLVARPPLAAHFSIFNGMRSSWKPASSRSSSSRLAAVPIGVE